MAQAFTEPVEKVEFNCEKKECKNYKTYDNCKQCCGNTKLKGRYAYIDRYRFEG